MADEPTTDKLTIRQHRALIALLSEPSVSKAAITADVPERTLRSWMRRPDFAAVYRDERRASMQQAMALSQQYSGTVMRNMVKLALSAKREADQIVAGKIVLEFGTRTTEIEDLRDQIEQLSALVREMSHEPTDV